MKQKTTLMMVLVAILGLSLQSCGGDEVEVSAPSFKVVNISETGDKTLTASSDSKIIVINYTTMITINGEQQVFTGSRSSNELPVMAGNEIEIIASFDDNAVTSNICFTMPDGSMQTVTKANPSCKWTVPSNFSSGDKINAQWADESGKIQHQDLTSSIVLIAIEN